MVSFLKGSYDPCYNLMIYDFSIPKWSWVRSRFWQPWPTVTPSWLSIRWFSCFAFKVPKKEKRKLKQKQSWKLVPTQAKVSIISSLRNITWVMLKTVSTWISDPSLRKTGSSLTCKKIKDEKWLGLWWDTKEKGKWPQLWRD